MANTIRLRRSAVQNAVPTTAQLALGELAINTFDGKLYLKKNDGTESVVEIGGGGSASTTVSDTPPSNPVANQLWWNSSIGSLNIYYNDGNSSQWVDTLAGYAVGSSGPLYPQNIQSGNYTLALADAGKHIYSANTGAQTITIPTNASVAFPIGSTITIVNMGANRIVLSIAGVSLVPADTVSPLTSAQVPVGSSVQLVKVAANSWKALYGIVTVNSVTLEYLVIAGGGSGGGSNGGGGGAGGYRTSTTAVTPGATYVITVGAGAAGVTGLAQGLDGNDSSLVGTGVSITSTKGGGGGSQNGINTGRSGGSGGGGAYPAGSGGTGTATQGNNGGIGASASGNGGGGGGASAVGIGADAGTTPCKGGDGIASSITGTSITRGGGGGGGGSDRFGAGGVGGGGAGGQASASVSGTPNTGGGGGGGQTSAGTSGAGGSGVVILSIPTVDYSGVTTGSPAVTTSGSNTILAFTSSGSYTA